MHTNANEKEKNCNRILKNTRQLVTSKRVLNLLGAIVGLKKKVFPTGTEINLERDRGTLELSLFGLGLYFFWSLSNSV